MIHKPNIWDPEQYAKFEAERNLPFYDLLNLILPISKMNILDLGCGTGKLTRVLHEILESKNTLGIDSSKEMLDVSQSYRCQDLNFELIRIENYIPKEKYDLIFSNAALQWVPDHFTLFTKLASYLTIEGQLAVQIPANIDSPTHVMAAELAREKPFSDELNGNRLFKHILTLEEYSKLLYELGFERQIVRLQIYPHIMDSSESIFEWLKGSLLTFFKANLSPEKYELFNQAYREKIQAFYGEQQPVFFPLKRILIWAQR
jgi:trans-aconitate 2-methyltransferase